VLEMRPIGIFKFSAGFQEPAYLGYGLGDIRTSGTVDSYSVYPTRLVLVLYGQLISCYSPALELSPAYDKWVHRGRRA
jgi:hypothetical protein